LRHVQRRPRGDIDKPSKPEEAIPFIARIYGVNFAAHRRSWLHQRALLALKLASLRAVTVRMMAPADANPNLPSDLAVQLEWMKDRDLYAATVRACAQQGKEAVSADTMSSAVFIRTIRDAELGVPLEAIGLLAWAQGFAREAELALPLNTIKQRLRRTPQFLVPSGGRPGSSTVI
jgi:hypothetical protein